MKPIAIAAAFAVAAIPGAVMAQDATQSSAATPATGDVSASTSGSALGTPTSVGVGGTADARAANGGTASASSSAKFNDHMANQRSTATASDSDERARSMTHSHASKTGADVSHSTSFYKQKGEKPVVSNETDVTTPKEKAAANAGN